MAVIIRNKLEVWDIKSTWNLKLCKITNKRKLHFWDCETITIVRNKRAVLQNSHKCNNHNFKTFSFSKTEQNISKFQLWEIKLQVWYIKYFILFFYLFSYEKRSEIRESRNFKISSHNYEKYGCNCEIKSQHKSYNTLKSKLQEKVWERNWEINKKLWNGSHWSHNYKKKTQA